jgi:IPT/TIG domain
MHPIRASRRALLRIASAALPLLAACGDPSGTPSAAPDTDGPLPRSTIGALRCTATIARASVACEDISLSGVGSQSGSGPRMNSHILGGQGTYVRLTSASPAYNAGTQIFSFTVTVQDLANLALATADGATRHNSGVQVFFSAPPVVTSGNVSPITIANETGQATFTSTGQDYFQYGGQLGGVDQPELGADGILSTAEVSSAKSWQLNVASDVGTFSFVLYVSTETPPGSLSTAAPQVTSVSPNPLVPGASATLTGINFSATPASNAVTIGGRAATVTGGSTTSLTVTVPCTGSGSVPMWVTTGGMKGATFSHPLQVSQRTLGVGQALILTSSAESLCNELSPTGAVSRYLVTVFSVSTSPSSNSPFQLSGDPNEASPSPEALRAPEQPTALPALSLDQAMEAARQQGADLRHYQLLERNRSENERLRAHFGTGSVPRPNIRGNVVAGDPALTRTFRIPNVAAAGFCNSYYVVNATRVYFDGKLAIYEDDATPDAFKGALNPTMASNYQKIGDQFNADMEPIVRTNFGDILRRDAVTDNNGIEIALFTPRINNSFSGVAGFVVSCDQYPNDDANSPAVGGPYTGTGANGSSNFGEYFYAYEPTVAGTSYTTFGTANYWYRTIRSTFIHESKHVASMAARVANGASFEASWLEEGTARHSEELWMRNAVDNVAWKGNTGYGSFATPLNLYCDARPGFAECDANTRRPAVIMQRHFTTLTNLFPSQNAVFYSPFGPSPNDTQSLFYAFSWSLIRYAVDRYGASDAAFLTALTNSTTTGATNLAARAGVSIDQLVGGWGLTLYADDYPGLGAPSADIQFPTWNMRSIYAGLNTDFPSTYTSPFLLVPTPLSFGTFAPLASTTMRGGGTRFFEFSGTHSAAQLLRLEASGGGTPSSNLRVAVARLE